MRRRAPPILVGTSGYAYDHWVDVLYPRGLARSRWLACYASRFPTVEINATFYRLPTARAVAGWKAAVPPGFTFSCKGSRFITHMKRLRDASLALERYFAPLGELGDSLGCVLWQLPPGWVKPDLERLEAFLQQLPAGPRHAFELRDAAWYTEAVCALLDRHGVAFCEHDLVDAAIPRVTGGFRYLRRHGRTGDAQGRYGPARLRRLAEQLREGPGGQACPAYVYFNNDAHGHAVRDALDLTAALGLSVERGAHPPPV